MADGASDVDPSSPVASMRTESPRARPARSARRISSAAEAIHAGPVSAPSRARLRSISTAIERRDGRDEQTASPTA